MTIKHHTPTGARTVMSPQFARVSREHPTGLFADMNGFLSLMSTCNMAYVSYHYTS